MATATPIQLLEGQTKSWTFDDPKNSSVSPGTYNAYVTGGPYFYALHGELDTAAIDPSATPEQRAAALEDLPVILSEGHIKGSKWSKPEDDDQTLLVKVPSFAVASLQACNDTCFEALYENLEKWNLKRVSRETVEDAWDPLLKQKDGKEGYAMSVKFYKNKLKGKILVQNGDKLNDFDPNGTQFDMKQGIRFAAVIKIGGIRIRLKPREYSCTKPTIEKIILFAGTGYVAPPMDLGGIAITTTSKAIEPSAAMEEDEPQDPADAALAAAAAASGPVDPMTMTMVGGEAE